MKILTTPALALIPALLLLATPAAADTYKWTDANGQVHFGDKPPAGARNAVNLSPASASPPSSSSSSSGSEAIRPAAAGASKAAPESSRSVMERQKRLADILQQENEEREAAAKNVAAEKAERQRNCNMLRDYQKNMERARMYNLNDKGERVYMDDQQRAELESNISSRISENCE